MWRTQRDVLAIVDGRFCAAVWPCSEHRERKPPSHVLALNREVREKAYQGGLGPRHMHSASPSSRLARVGGGVVGSVIGGSAGGVNVGAWALSTSERARLTHRYAYQTRAGEAEKDKAASPCCMSGMAGPHLCIPRRRLSDGSLEIRGESRKANRNSTSFAVKLHFLKPQEVSPGYASPGLCPHHSERGAPVGPYEKLSACSCC